MAKKKYCLVGTGVRGVKMFLLPLVKDYADVAELTGICDLNPGRLALAKRLLGRDVPAFTDFGEMLANVSCDTVIVTTKDATHHEYIIKALEAGKDVITEKPMTIDDEKCRAILAAEERAGRRVRGTFNYRYAPFKTKIKELLRQGIVGEIFSVEFRWFLDTVHGADYYRRWHAQKANSGGLLVHKATHHFDLVNWWTGQEPELVFALGARRFYGPTRDQRSERCLDCRFTSACQFHLDLRADEELRSFYLENEAHDGYHRDGCVFSPRIDIEDTMSVLVRYKNGMLLSYNLSSYAPFEGWSVAFNGPLGRLEATEEETFLPTTQPRFAARTAPENRYPADWYLAAFGEKERKTRFTIRFYPVYGGVETFTVPASEGGHGGGDRRLLEMLFREDVLDPLGHAATSRDGAMSILIGIAANKSIATGQPVRIAELLGRRD
ncbi:MAG: Gfo/Idh/MocA family oxidoreductase [Firmicutes bacterium]|nr:Gfo/Idh/MocA family oxidoreductase [Bacillota bacterium]